MVIINGTTIILSDEWIDELGKQYEQNPALASTFLDFVEEQVQFALSLGMKGR